MKARFSKILAVSRCIYAVMFLAGTAWLAIAQTVLKTPSHCMITGILLVLQSLINLAVTRFFALKYPQSALTIVNGLLTLGVYALEVTHFGRAITRGNIHFWSQLDDLQRTQLDLFVHTSAQIYVTYLYLAFLMTLSLLCTLQTLRLIRYERCKYTLPFNTLFFYSVELSSLVRILMDYHT